MSDIYLPLKLLHVLGAAVLFGTGLGIAFFMWMAHCSRNADFIARTAGIVVIADLVFTASAVVIQPLTGVGMAWIAGYPATTTWIAASVALYLFVGLCWLPVVWIQLRLRNLARAAAENGGALPPQYHALFRVWFWLGWPAFLGVIAIFALMVWKPGL